MTNKDVLGFKTNDNKQQQTITFPMIVRLFNERAKTDTSHRIRGSSTPAVVITSTSSSSSSEERDNKEKDKDKEREKETPKITEEDRALLESIPSPFLVHLAYL